ncbi:MAG: class I tRNA ligase family protein, partial [Candidatus Hydrothermarchaeales archaeon]
MIEQAEKRFDLKRVEERTEEFWQKNQIYNKTKKRMKGGKRFYFLDGPPYASGSIHLGTAWNKI